MNRWKRRVNLAGIFHAEEMTFEERRDAIVDVIRHSTWFKVCEEGDDLPQFLEELGDTEDAEGFDVVMGAIYDVADDDRTWIVT